MCSIFVILHVIMIIVFSILIRYPLFFQKWYKKTNENVMCDLSEVITFGKRLSDQRKIVLL